MSAFHMSLELARLVERGVKTTHHLYPARGRRRPEIGDSVLIVQSEGREPICHVEVLAVVRRFLHETTDDEAVREGHADRGEFFRWWRETVEGVEAPASTDEPVSKTVPVWVVRFQVDQRRMLPNRLGEAYTSSPASAARSEGECVSEDEQNAQTKRQREIWNETAVMRRMQRDVDARRRVEPSPLKGLGPEDRAVVLDLCAALREAQKMDRSRQVAAIRRRIDAIRNKARRDRAA